VKNAKIVQLESNLNPNLNVQSRLIR